MVDSDNTVGTIFDNYDKYRVKPSNVSIGSISSHSEKESAQKESAKKGIAKPKAKAKTAGLVSSTFLEP